MDSYMSSSIENSPNSAPALGSSSNTDKISNRFTRLSTPPPRPTANVWYGLPSPNTPGFSDGLPETLKHSLGRGEANQEQASLAHRSYEHGKIIAESEDPEEEDVTMSARESSSAVTTLNHDHQLGRELDEFSHSATVRRSTRVRTQVSSYNLSPTPPADPRKATKPKAKAAPTSATCEVSVPFELTVTPANADPIPFEGLPVLRTTDWELKYPPGGSTHPSYPYPTLDPRLIFCQPFVPVIDGLPDFSKVPKLVLPMGWRQVTWSGLLPVVFDPYHQAFKLTPVGPLPLTCEELQQGGLQKYVPGGELHPETSVLPDMTSLADGSVDEVYNWEGVDWTLPWAEHKSSGLVTSSASEVPVFSRGAVFQNHNVSTFVIVSPWREARDCPNLILDLEDAWRWLSGKEQQPDADFIPISAKRPRNGASRSNRKTKSPIPELMIGAKIADPDEANPVIQNQDAKLSSKNNEFCPYKSVATPMNVDITLLADTEFTLMELLSYFPQHYYWGHAAERLARAGASSSVIRNIINMTRALEGEAALKTSTVYSATRKSKQEMAKQEDVTEATEIDQSGAECASAVAVPDSKQVTTNYTAEGWTYDAWSRIDYPLLALAHGLQQPPAGPDAGPLTSLIKWCRKNERYRVLLSEVPDLLKEAEIGPLIEPGEEGCPDKDVAPRHHEAMKKDGQRVKRSLEVLKRATEDELQCPRKKRKMSEII
ncbi:hypothetical protein LEMA_P082670.1 [Plenodomus lingam JN3]|uniref:Uncharacterized protein n=1 Tax=Leptosphaeria maculans (strain JN3 / isolate v23.1.3 / race Av1-4-5-6-7-8) TaxID=985895 RepID=E5A5Y3_LEPMJ|nr:hypothetical protein LEMA_P082670.1 [Plenodomus lingam JN3]CBX99028.1 hypothetical protein LEMA_P082670.1 [Plenodomus lingam JN3]